MAKDDERSLMKQLKQKFRSPFSSKNSSSSRNLNVPDARPTSANFPSTAPTPLSVSQPHSTSRVHLGPETGILNPPSTASTLTSRLISYASCINLNRARRSWVRSGRIHPYRLSTSQQDARKLYLGNSNARRYALDPCLSLEI